jgi:hypothetical protein
MNKQLFNRVSDIAKERNNKVELAKNIIDSAYMGAQKISNDARTESSDKIIEAALIQERARDKLMKWSNEIDALYKKREQTAKEIGVDFHKTGMAQKFREAQEEVLYYWEKCLNRDNKIRNFKI